MGFNYEQYEIAMANNDDSYSNAGGCNILHPFSKSRRQACEKATSTLKLGSGKLKAALGIGSGKIFGKVINPTKNAKWEAGVTSRSQALVLEQAKADAQARATEQEIIAVSTAPIGRAPAGSSPEGTAPKSNTMLYVGIGAGVLILGTVITILITRK